MLAAPSLNVGMAPGHPVSGLLKLGAREAAGPALPGPFKWGQL